jgi:hypothetical protein
VCWGAGGGGHAATQRASAPRLCAVLDPEPWAVRRRQGCDVRAKVPIAPMLKISIGLICGLLRCKKDVHYYTEEGGERERERGKDGELERGRQGDRETGRQGEK